MFFLSAQDIMEEKDTFLSVWLLGFIPIEFTKW